MTTTQTQMARRELGRFFEVAAAFGQPAYMPACPVDAEWHTLIDDKAAYARFCRETVGLDHVGHEPAKGEGPVDWVPAYETRFGQLPEIWFRSPDGVLNAPAYRQYRETGVARLSWDCAPAIKEKGAKH